MLYNIRAELLAYRLREIRERQKLIGRVEVDESLITHVAGQEGEDTVNYGF